jgi:hypothetical protein
MRVYIRNGEAPDWRANAGSSGGASGFLPQQNFRMPNHEEFIGFC